MKEVIENWMIATIGAGSWKNYDDLHIDEISSEYKIKSNWVFGLINSLKTAIEIRNDRKLNFIVGIGISLHASLIPKGISFDSIESLQNEMDWSPPSLYLFQPQWEDWREIEEKGICVENFNLGIDNEKKYLLEFYKSEDRKYRRSVFIVSLLD